MLAYLSHPIFGCQPALTTSHSRKNPLMSIIKCLNCGKISNSEAEVICLRCNADLSASRLAASQKKYSPSMPGWVDPKKLIIGAVVLIVAVVGFKALWSWKADRARANEEKKQLEMSANFDNLRFDNNEAAINNALKMVPAKFNVQPPDPEKFKADLSAEIAKKDHDNYTSTNRQTGTYDYTQKLQPTYNQGSLTYMQPGGGMTTTGGPGPTSVTMKMKAFEKVETKYANKYVLMDLSVTDFNYVKAPGEKLVCFVKYSAKTGQFQSSSTVQPWNPTQPASPSNPNLGTKIKDWTATENARYEYEEGKWTLKTAGISELDKMRQIDELKAAAKGSPAPPAAR